jgi:muconolactone delta-isomerase
MRYLVSINFVQGQEEARAALLPAEQALVRRLMEQGIVEAGYLSADRTRSWMVLRGESQDHIQQTMASLPFYPFMELEMTPLLDVRPGAATVEASQSPVAR